ncbi:MAG TPA: hypothetical protein VHA11_01880 [Bryobacteraceae bacterium]|nr:hypothetical protein [Bryobacteraceae bacterium]
MKREDLERLLGGWAAGTLTPEERRALLEAAMSDQALFDALAMEEPLRDALADEAARARVLAALDAPAPRFSDRFAAWLARPQGWALGASVAGAVVLAIVALRFGNVPQPAPPPVPKQIAELHPAQPAPPVPVNKAARPAPAARTQRVPARVPAQAESRGRAAAPPPPAAATAGAVSEAVRVEPQRGLATATARDAAVWRPDMSARALFVQHRPPQAPVPASAPPGLGLRYTLLRRDVVGNYFDVPAGTALSPGETARLRIEANEPGYLYVLGDRGTLFNGPVGAHEAITLDVQPEMLRAVLARQPDTGPIETVAWRTRTQLTGVRLAVEAPAQLRPRDPSVYVVNPSAAPDARVLTEIRINGR